MNTAPCDSLRLTTKIGSFHPHFSAGRAATRGDSRRPPMDDTAQKRGNLIRYLEAALELADQLQDGPLEYLIERAIDEARSRYFMPPRQD
jgi:hypothetical protein